MRAKAFLSVAVAFSVVVVVLLEIVARGNDSELRSRQNEVSRHVHLMLHKLSRRVQRWNPFSKRLSVCAPFAAVRWHDSVPEVQVKGTWYELLSLDDIPVEEIVGFCKKTCKRTWRKSFEEDLVITLVAMGKQGHFDSETGSLKVRRLDTDETLVLTNVAWTNANRAAILDKAIEADKANGGKDPRDDPSYP